IVYLKTKLAGDESTIEARTIADGSSSVIYSGKGLLDFWWTSGGKLIYTQADNATQATYGLWQGPVDARSERITGQPRRLTRWVGFSPGFVSVSADGRRITTTKGYSQSDVYVADFEGDGIKLKAPRQLTLDTRSDWPTAWLSRNEIL